MFDFFDLIYDSDIITGGIFEDILLGHTIDLADAVIFGEVLDSADLLDGDYLYFC